MRPFAKTLLFFFKSLLAIVAVGLFSSQVAFATLTPAEISARIATLSGLSTSEIDEIYVAQQAAQVVLIAADVIIPIVSEPESSYLLIKVASTGQWIRVNIDSAEWDTDFVPYFLANGVEMHSQPSGTIASATPGQEAIQLASVALINGATIANLVINGSNPDSDSDGVDNNIDGFPFDGNRTLTEFAATADGVGFSFSMMLRLVCNCALGSTIEYQIGSEPWASYVKPLVFDQTTTVSARIHSQGADGLVQTKTYTRTLIAN